MLLSQTSTKYLFEASFIASDNRAIVANTRPGPPQKESKCFSIWLSLIKLVPILSLNFE